MDSANREVNETRQKEVDDGHCHGNKEE